MGTSPRHSRGSFAVMGIRLLLILFLGCLSAERVTGQCILADSGGPCPPSASVGGATFSNFTGSAPFTLTVIQVLFPFAISGLQIDSCLGLNPVSCLFVTGPGHLTVSFTATGLSGFTVDIGGVLQPPGRVDVSVTTPNSSATCSFDAFPPTSCVISNFPGGLITINIDAFPGPPGGGATEGAVAVHSLTFGTAGATPLSITTPKQLKPGVAGQAYSVPLTATGGQPPYTWSVVNVGSPPVSPLDASHLTLDPSSGLISGPRIYGGSNKFTVTVTDSAGATTQKTFTIDTPCGFTKGDYPFVRLADYAQYQATASSTLIVPYTFGYLPNPNPVGYNRCKTSISGCTLTMAAGMLATITGGDPIAATATPIWLDSQFVNQNPTGYGTGRLSNSYGPQLAGQPDWCEFDAGTWSFALPLSDQFNIALDPLSGPLSASFSPAVDDLLESTVCEEGEGAILRLTQLSDGGTHFVLATGRIIDGGSGLPDWQVFDGGKNPSNTFDFNSPNSTSPASKFYTLTGHTSGFWWAKNGDTSNLIPVQYGLSASRLYSSSSTPASVIIGGGSPIEILVADAAGRQTGNSGSGNDLFQIPNSTYLRDGLLEDDADGGLATADTTTKKGVYISNPAAGTYSVTVAGTGLGTYTLRYIALATDHTAHITSVPGIANVGSVARYNVSFSPVPGSVVSLNVLATFASTLADISNCLELGLIDNAGIANALSAKINAASDAAAVGDTATASNVLNAFKNQVSAQTGKHITGVALEVLQGDADSLLSH